MNESLLGESAKSAFAKAMADKSTVKNKKDRWKTNGLLFYTLNPIP
jgi:hypothetical protein